MNENTVFRNPIQEVEHLGNEINEIKSMLKDIAFRLSQIERHTKRAFNIPIPKKNDRVRKSKPTKEPADTIISTDEALKLFDELTEIWKTNGGIQVEKRLEDMSTPNIKKMARELGITFKSKPSRKEIYSGIIGRINERIILSSNINILKPITTNTLNSTLISVVEESLSK